MATVKQFEDLLIWQKARELARKVYELTAVDPIAKDFRLKDQMRGCVGSIMDNIAEGFGRSSRLEFINSLTISQGEANELKSQLYRALDAMYISQQVFQQLYDQTDEVSKMIAAFIKYLNSTEIRGAKFKNRRSNGSNPN